MNTHMDFLRAQLSDARFFPSVMPHVAARIMNEPLLIEPMKLVAVLSGIGARIGLEGVRPTSQLAPTVIRADRADDYTNMDGIAVVQVFGSIVKRNGGGVLNSSGLVSLEALKETIASAKSNSTVRGVLLQLDTPGGEAVGTPEFAKWLFDQRDDGKPIWCVIDDMAASAGAYVAAACAKTFVTATGIGGSIGVIGIHVDASEAYAKEGYKITPIFAGDRKIDGAQWAPLSVEAFNRFQARIDAMWETFTADVGTYRRIKQSTVKDYQAITFHGQELVDARLADGVATFDDVLTEFQSRVSGAPARRTGGSRMEPIKEPGAKTASLGAETNVVAIDQYRTDLATAEAAGRTAERARCKRIEALAATSVRVLGAKGAKTLATKLIDENASIEQACDAFTDACAHADTLKAPTEITGERGAGTLAAGITVPVMREREDVLTQRFQTPAVRRREMAFKTIAEQAAQRGLLADAGEGGR